MAHDEQARRARLNITPIFLPSRAPELNPVENVLAVSPPELKLSKHRLRKLRRDRRRRMRRLAKSSSPSSKRSRSIGMRHCGSCRSAAMTLGSLHKAAASGFLFVVMVAISVKRSMVLFGVRGMTISAIIRACRSFPCGRRSVLNAGSDLQHVSRSTTRLGC